MGEYLRSESMSGLGDEHEYPQNERTSSAFHVRLCVRIGGGYAVRTETSGHVVRGVHWRNNSGRYIRLDGGICEVGRCFAE